MDVSTLEALAGGPVALAAAARLATAALESLTRDARGEVLGGSCRGADARVYAVRAQLRYQPPRVRCSCPSRRRPCKHGLALLSRWLSDPGAFQLAGQLEAPLPGLDDARPPLPPAPAPRGRDVARLRLQQQGLRDARALLEELVVTGVGGLGASGLNDLRMRAEGLSGQSLPALTAGLRRLAEQLAAPVVDPAQQRRRVATGIARLAQVVWRGEAWVEHQLEGGPDAGESAPGRHDDDEAETALGKVWTLAELRARGRGRRLTLVELAWWREDDAGLEARVDTSALIELESGAWFLESLIVPLHLTGQSAPKASHPGVLELDEALIYPGPAPARVRWTPGAARSRAGKSEDWSRLLAHAQPLARILRRIEEEAAAPLHEAPHLALLAVQQLVHLERGVGLLDPQGQLLAIDDRAAAVLRAWGAPRGPLAAAISLGADRSVPRATLHALLTPEGPVRVGD